MWIWNIILTFTCFRSSHAILVGDTTHFDSWNTKQNSGWAGASPGTLQSSQAPRESIFKKCPRKYALVYDDDGVTYGSVQNAVHSLGKYLDGKLVVRTVNSLELWTNEWEQCTELLVMPGGRDLKYLELLSNVPVDVTPVSQDNVNTRIREWVLNKGGKYLGLCAGAYYGSSFVDFERATPMQVLGKRPLNFLPVVAKGCIVGYKYGSEAGARALKVVPTSALNDGSFDDLELNEPIKVYYNGGCFFEYNNSTSPEVQLLATYELEETPECLTRPGLPPTPPPEIYPAIVGRHFPGNGGKVVLSGVHAEFDTDLMEPTSYNYHYYFELLEDNKKRYCLWEKMLKYIGL